MFRVFYCKFWDQEIYYFFVFLFSICLRTVKACKEKLKDSHKTIFDTKL